MHADEYADEGVQVSSFTRSVHAFVQYTCQRDRLTQDLCPLCTQRTPQFPRHHPLPRPSANDHVFPIGNAGPQLFELTLHEPDTPFDTRYVWLMPGFDHMGHMRSIRYLCAIGPAKWVHSFSDAERFFCRTNAFARGAPLLFERHGEQILLSPPIAHVIPYLLPNL